MAFLKFPICFVILDGFGIASPGPFNAVTSAHTPTLNLCKTKYKYTTLRASGKSVGLPDGYVGNSEVGHITIGAGRVILQPLTRINNTIKDGSFFHHPHFDYIKDQIQKTRCRVHIMGLLSDVGVHSHIEHFFAILRALSMRNITDVFIHPILDGRDAIPCSASEYLTRLENCMTQYKIGKIGTLHGRLYAMDRDNNWKRTKASYDVLTNKNPSQHASWRDILQMCQQNEKSEEFLKPIQLLAEAVLQPHDVLLFLNYREDRAIQLVEALIDSQFRAFNRAVFVPIQCITPIPYESIQSKFFYDHKQVQNSLKELCSINNKKIVTIAETEKFAHVTYFLSGGRHEPFLNETQLLIPSLKYERYDAVPAMQATEITKRAIQIDTQYNNDIYIINYANADMVGHSGNFEATVQAIEILDKQIAQLYCHFVINKQGILIISADHGKAECMYNPVKRDVITGHTANPVPFFFITENKIYKDISISKLEALKDIAPFILKLLKIKIPKEMNFE